jgi:hypothetical protein
MKPKHSLIRNRRFKLKPKYKMGDWNKDNTKRFWAYIKGAEAWVSPERFNQAREKARWWK